MNYIFTMLIVCIGLTTSPPQKPQSLFLTKQPPPPPALNLQTVQASSQF